jgi:hypothetical protein
MFGFFTTDSWIGMNLASTTWNEYSYIKREKLVKQNKLDKIVIVDPFQNLETYSSYIQNKPSSHITLLDQKIKTGGYINYENINYITLSKIYLKNSLDLIRTNPNIYLEILRKGYVFYTNPPSNSHLFKENLKHIQYYDGIFNLIFYGGGLYTFFAIPLVIYFAFKKMFYNLKKKKYSISIFLGFLLITIIYTGLIGNMFELGENNRSFFIVQIYLIILFLLNCCI